MKIRILILALFASNMFYGQTWNQTASNVGANGTFLGLFDNFPLRINTANITRMRINNTLSGVGQYGVNGFTATNGLNTSGYNGIGTNNAATLNILTSGTKGPFSLLHLNGPGTVLQEFGHRLWMQTGITFTSNNDRMYIGHRSNGANDVTDAVFNWSDNAAGASGPDNMVFSFTTGDGSGGVNDLTGNSPNGREIMRLTGTGNVGIGPLFTNTNIPQSTLHLHTENNVASWLQVSNQNIGLTVNDGLRIGANNSLNSYMFNQENGSLIFNTNFNTSNLGRERMRISHIGATGVPVTSTANFTRIGISLDPTDPITQPRSLLHIGYNTGIPGFATQDGHRNWMDVGTMAVRGSDNIYVGLKQEGTNVDRQDAVIAWGDNQTSFNNNGPDYLRFIFARSAVSPSGDAISATTDGLEVGRFTPTGELGIGNFFNGGLGLPTERIDADGNARLRTLPLQPNRRDTLEKVVLVDTNGVLRWKYMSNMNAASNGCSIDAAAPNEVRLGENVNFLTGQANLQSTRYTNMLNSNIMYGGQGTNGIRTAYGIGTPPDSLNLRGKLHVHERFNINLGDPNEFFPTAGYFRNSSVNINSVQPTIYRG